jgi:hypothetical protein
MSHLPHSAGSDPAQDPEGEFDFAPVRRRGETHRLALVSAAALVAIVIAVVKPWGQSVPPGPLPAASHVAKIADSSTQSEVPTTSAAAPTSDQPAFDEYAITAIAMPGDSTPATSLCYSSDVPSGVATRIRIAADPSAVVYFQDNPEAAGSGAVLWQSCGGTQLTVPVPVLPSPTPTPTPT